jgi:phosphopantothenoylcysteine synthetase/decarboxylase
MGRSTTLNADPADEPSTAPVGERWCTLVVCGAPLAARAGDLVAALQLAGWKTRVIATTAAQAWLSDIGISVETAHRSPKTPKPQRRSTAMVVAPITFNTINKLAHGMADTLAHSSLCEALGEGIPMLAVPMLNNYLAGHPSLARNVELLSAARVTWINPHTGKPDDFAAVQSGTGDDVVRRFDPRWILTQLPVGSPGG